MEGLQASGHFQFSATRIEELVTTVMKLVVAKSAWFCRTIEMQVRLGDLFLLLLLLRINSFRDTLVRREESVRQILHRRGGTGIIVLSPQVDFPQKTMSWLLAPLGAQWIKQLVKMISTVLIGVQKPAMWPSCSSPPLRCCPRDGASWILQRSTAQLDHHHTGHV